MNKMITKERYEICPLCAGRGKEFDITITTTTGPASMPCRSCSGSGQRLVERTITSEIVRSDFSKFVLSNDISSAITGAIEDNQNGLRGRIRKGIDHTS